jgi:outer membrane protein assembly factor BamB
LPAGTWDEPPVRGGDGTATATRGRSRTTLEMEAAENRARAKKRRVTWVIAGIVGLVCLVIVGGIGAAWYVLVHSEERDREAAEQLYADGQFAQASDAYAKLMDKYSDSPHLDDYKFWRELSAVRALPMSSSTGAFDRVSSFLQDYKGDPRLDEHGKEVGDVMAQLLESAGKDALDKPRDLEAQEHFKRGRAVLEELRAVNGGRGWVPAGLLKKLEETNEQVVVQEKKERERRDFIARVQRLPEKPPLVALRELGEMVKAEEAKKTGFEQEPEMKQMDDQLRERHRASIVFTPAEELLPNKGAAEDVEQGLVVHPLVTSSGDANPPLPANRVVFALARGVLYGLSQNNGDILWAMRVGIDTTHLPLRVPPAGNAPELALVLSADTLTLTAVIARTGETLWKRPLGAASTGRPVIVDRRVYVPTLNGEVHEIELAGGGLLGRYKLGQPLSVGGTYYTYFVNGKQIKQVFFPGDDSCVYVLDVDRRECQAVLYTEHEAGWLRSEPIVLPSEDDPNNAPGYVVLCQEHGLDATLLRTFSLLPPIPPPGAAPGTKESRLRVEPVPKADRRLRGWPWFPPFRDPEKLITVTDAGVLGLFGVVQARNKDEPLFPLVRVPEQEEGSMELTGLGTARGRAQVVFARGDDLWVLARGRLLRYWLTLNGQAGPRAVPAPGFAPLDIGSPLHDSQMDDDGTTLFLVTLAPNGKACLATAVDAETGKVRWQRQVGLVCHGDPLALGNEVVALDQGGGLFAFRANKRLDDADWQWQSAGHALAEPLSGGAAGSVYFVRGPDGQSVFQFTCPDDPGNRVIVREFQAGRDKAAEYAIADLPARLAGTPAVGPNRILLPLANGDTRVVHLGGAEGKSADGPPWRATRGDVAARGHVVWLGGDDFLTTNGRRGLTRWRFREGDLFDSVPAEKDARKPTLELPEDIAGAPVVLSRAGGGAALRVCVADDRGTVYLFEGDELKLARQWPLGEPLAAGPFARGGMAGCVVGRRRLVWLDPARDDPLWHYESPGEGIIGQPQVADGMVLVADVTGRFVGLDPATGRARGPGYQLRASTGPAAAPAGFSPGRAFAPLTDATVLLLPLHHLREPLPGLPPVW